MTTVLREYHSTGEARALGKDPRNYPLGYSKDEFSRLERQGALLAELTRDVLVRAGVDQGMRVLDVGCGVGDVSLVAAELVGASGEVLGVDRSLESVEIATRRAANAGRSNVSFVRAELDALISAGHYDALIGRLVLLYLPFPSQTLRRLRGHLRPGVIVVFQEMAMVMGWSSIHGAEFNRYRDLIIATFERAGIDLDMGGKLFTTFIAAGLPEPQMTSAAVVGGGVDSPIYDYIANTARSLLPMMERLGVATAAEVEIDTAAERVRQETIENNACIVLPPLIGAWTRTSA